jgi:hypothetical protein
MRIVIVKQDGVITGIFHDHADVKVIIKEGDSFYRCSHEVKANTSFVREQFDLCEKQEGHCVEGTFENICAHQVCYFFKSSKTITPEMEELLDEHAEERAKSLIIDGCVEGELYYQDHLENEYSGWWKIMGK